MTLFPPTNKQEDERDLQRLAALIRIFGRQSCRDHRFVDWLLTKTPASATPCSLSRQQTRTEAGA